MTRKLTADLPKPFMLQNNERIDDTPVHKAIREAFVNLIIHADYFVDSGTLKIIKVANGYQFTNPGTLKLPIDEIFKGGNSKPRNPRMQTMLRMVGFGDNAGSGFPTILNVWKKGRWIEPQLLEDTRLNQVTLTLRTIPEWVGFLEEVIGLIKDNIAMSDEMLQAFEDALEIEKLGLAGAEDVKFENVVNPLVENLSLIPDLCINDIENVIIEFLNWTSLLHSRRTRLFVYVRLLSEKLAEKSAEKSAKTAEKSAEKSAEKVSKKYRQILAVMEADKVYSANEIAILVGLKGPRTRQLLGELVTLGEIKAVGVTKGRRYMKANVL